MSELKHEVKNVKIEFTFKCGKCTHIFNKKAEGFEMDNIVSQIFEGENVRCCNCSTLLIAEEK